MTPFQPSVDPAVFARFPEYRALSLVVSGYRPSSDPAVVAVASAPWLDAHTDAWHAAFRALGSNPKKFAPSMDALAKRFRKDGVLPAISPLVDCYNALSVRYGAPFGGEDLDRYEGAPRLTFAKGDETFDTARDGQAVIEHPEPGEAIWRDDRGVTCRRWNWRQCKRTALRSESVNLWFIIDRLAGMPETALQEAGEALRDALVQASPGAEASIMLLSPR